MSESKALHQARTWLETWHTKYVASLTALIEAARADERRACVATEARGRIDVRDRQGRYWRQYNDAWQDGVNALRDAIRADVREWEDQKRSCPRCGAEWRNEDGFGTACRKCNERGRVREMGDVTIRSIGTEERTGAAGGVEGHAPNLRETGRVSDLPQAAEPEHTAGAPCRAVGASPTPPSSPSPSAFNEITDRENGRKFFLLEDLSTDPRPTDDYSGPEGVLRLAAQAMNAALAGEPTDEELAKRLSSVFSDYVDGERGWLAVAREAKRRP